jgi:hypothetical protein
MMDILRRSALTLHAADGARRGQRRCDLYGEASLSHPQRAALPVRSRYRIRIDIGAREVGSTAIVADTDLVITVASAGKNVDKDITLGSNNFPGGALVQPGDVVTIDVI